MQSVSAKCALPSLPPGAFTVDSDQRLEFIYQFFMVDESIIGFKGKLPLSIAIYMAVIHTCRSLIVQGEESLGNILV